MCDLKWHEETRRGQDDQTQHNRLGSGCSNIADDDLERGNGSRQKLVYRTCELGEEDAEIQGRRDNRRDDALQQCTPEPCHLELVDCADRVKVHRLSFTKPMKISSSELCFVWRSLNLMPVALRAASKAAMSVRSVCVSYV